jgi:hypothetical protein
MRDADEIGDDAFHLVEHEPDWFEAFGEAEDRLSRTRHALTLIRVISLNNARPSVGSCFTSGAG